VQSPQEPVIGLSRLPKFVSYRFVMNYSVLTP
jgi:hypothetical protein